MKKTDLADVIRLVKSKIGCDASSACGFLWADSAPTTEYAVGEEDVVAYYGVSEECTTRYGINECDE